MAFAEAQNELKANLAADVLNSFGSTRIRVQGSSMLPSLRPGDEVDLQSIQISKIKIGEIVAFRRDGRLFVHRVFGRNKSGELVTRGDTLPQADAPVAESELLGVVTAVLRNGKSVDCVNSFGQRVSAALFRRSQFCAALFVKLVCVNPSLRASG